MLETRNFVKLVFEPCLGVWQQFIQRHTRSLCWNGLWDHKQRNFVLDNNFSPAFNISVKLNRLQNPLPTPCSADTC